MNLTKHGNNADIRIHVLPDDEMRRLGFSDCVNTQWYFCRYLIGEVSFNITIEKDGSDWRIDILDEDFGQPYDYQYFLAHNANLNFSKTVKALVDANMCRLVEAGVISNWKVGDYV